MSNWENDSYMRVMGIRNRVLAPVARILTRVGVSADMLTYATILLMCGFIFLVKDYTGVAVGLLAVTVISDMLDGVLARHQKTASDRGKFTDVLTDNLNFTLFVIGLAYAGAVEALVAIVLVYFMLLSKLMRCIWYSFDYQSDWYFRAFAGFWPNLVVMVSYGLFLMWAFSGLNFMTEAFWVMSLTLVVDAVIYYLYLIGRRRK